MSGEPLFSGPALRVRQPIGDFWVSAIPATILLQATSPDPLRLISQGGRTHAEAGWGMAGELGGTQRKLENDRLKQIAVFIGTYEATFPNSIILAVDDVSAVEDSPGWSIRADASDIGTLAIPLGARKARVVDGQHRLYAFNRAHATGSFELLCAVFFGLPDPMQAYVFATINTNQKPVRRGLAMNLYGYNVEDQVRSEWSPEKLAVFVARRLNFDPDSALHRRIRIEAEGAPEAERLPGAKRPIPMAAVVDVALGLLSRHPKRDRDELVTRTSLLSRGRRKDLTHDDSAALREWYVEGRDAEIYDLLKAYWGLVDAELWTGGRAVLTRAVDIRALGDFLGDILRRLRGRGEGAAAVLAASQIVLRAARAVPFEDPFFEATYRGRRRVENALRILAGEDIWQGLSPDDRPHYERILAPDGRPRA